MSIDYQTVYNMSKYGISGAVIAGVFGYLIGKIFEKASKKK